MTKTEITIPNMAVCPWLTKDADVKKATALVTVALEGAKWKDAIEASGIGYSRGWLIVRWAEITLSTPNLFVAVEPTPDKDLFTHRLGTIVQKLVDDQKCSWGEVMVRTGQSEGACRKGFALVSGINDRGHRIGKGGRFVADRPDLYQDNRKVEGAWIPKTAELHPAPSQVQIETLRNYIPKDQPQAKAVRKPSKKA